MTQILAIHDQQKSNFWQPYFQTNGILSSRSHDDMILGSVAICDVILGPLKIQFFNYNQHFTYLIHD